MPPLTVVVVDDTRDYREIVRFLLRDLRDVVTIVGEAADGEEALTVALRERPDIVITDLLMPRLNGVELTRRIRQELPQTKIILMSTHTEDAYRLMASDSGADAFVNKRVIHDVLLPAIRDLIRAGFPVAVRFRRAPAHQSVRPRRRSNEFAPTSWGCLFGL